MTEHTYRQYVNLVRDCVAEHNVTISASGTFPYPDLYCRGHRLCWRGDQCKYNGRHYQSFGLTAIKEFDAKFSLGLFKELNLDIEDLL